MEPFIYVKKRWGISSNFFPLFCLWKQDTHKMLCSCWPVGGILPVFGGSQMLTRFSTRFSLWECIDTFKCENRNENRPHVLTWPRTGSNVYIFGEPDRFSHRTRIRFSDFSVSFLLGSSCSSSHLGLLLFSCCYYFFSHTAITFPIIILLSFLLLLFSFTAIAVLPLLLFSLYWYYSSLYYYLLFSHCSYSFPVAVTLVSLFSCDEVI